MSPNLSSGKRFRDLLGRLVWAIGGLAVLFLSLWHPVSAALFFTLVIVLIWTEAVVLIVPTVSSWALKWLPALFWISLAVGHLWYGHLSMGVLIGWWLVGLILIGLLAGRAWEMFPALAFTATLLFWALWCWLDAALHPYRPAWWLFWLILVWTNDTFAYLGGRLFGRHKIAPAISPGKTWEGLLVAAVATVAAAALMHALAFPSSSGLDARDYLLAGLLVSIAGPAGDMYESIIKRLAGVKDSSRLLGPHGGIWDRMDAWLWVAILQYAWVG